ncbi:Restriction endonuclease BglII [Hartmannibacter diazotrophicus]|uniref:Restriction endonuclease BglII n=1 Tax=Hartmannibacter diazotrophicus TaxID=1482074 RepID=A0A2C9D6S0_9HYPH|nr:BglII/BstYI family type II restriction endonuclease [Hartmannibacter diazotrophicus]SON55441.1 Restriction endonuclease BglII [Hartmannibacter diazotrophicus]
MMFQSLTDKGFQIAFLAHAKAILGVDFPDAIADLEAALRDLSIPLVELIASGGGETKGTQRLRRALAKRGWIKTNFKIEKIINGVPRESISHEVDHVRSFPERGVIALEIEWNNKDPFFDRDLENFKRLHAEGAISVGVIITRGTSLHDGVQDLVRRFAEQHEVGTIEDVRRLGLTPTPRQEAAVARRINHSGASFADAWSRIFCADKFGPATTHWQKLEDRVHRGVGNPCPLLLIGLPSSIVSFEPGAPAEDDAPVESDADWPEFRFDDES